MTDFYPGQKVVCVDASHHPGTGRHNPFNWPIREGGVYTVRKFALFHHGHRGLTPHVWLEEVRRFGYNFERQLEDMPFYFSRFKPLEEKPDAIEWARQICREAEQNTPTKIDAEVMEALGHLLAGRE